MARQMMQTPEFRRMLLDPEALRQAHEMQRRLGAMGLGGGMFGGPPGGGGDGAFPAPGVTDTTPDAAGTTRTPQQPDTTTNAGQQAPFNPFTMFGNPSTGAGTQANPFAALFNPAAFGNTPSGSPPPPASAGQGTPRPAQDGQTPPNPFAALGGLFGQPNPASGGEGGNQQAQNALGNLAQNPLFQNPELMRQMMAAFGGAGAGADPFSALMGGAPASAAPPDTRPPEERYAEQLRQLNDMGFYEFERNIEALRRTGGSVQGAVEYLLTH